MAVVGITASSYAVLHLTYVFLLGRTILWDAGVSLVILIVGLTLTLRVGRMYPLTACCFCGAALGQTVQVMFSGAGHFAHTRSVGFPFFAGDVLDGARLVVDMHPKSSPWIAVSVPGLVVNVAIWTLVAGAVGAGLLVLASYRRPTRRLVAADAMWVVVLIRVYCYLLLIFGFISWLCGVLDAMT